MEYKEHQIVPGRYLVSAGMGKGYEHLNAPEQAFHVLGFNLSKLTRDVSRQMVERGITSEFDQSDIDSGTAREINTAQLELEWLRGDVKMVEILLRGSKSRQEDMSARILEQVDLKGEI